MTPTDPNGPSGDILANTQLTATHEPPDGTYFAAVWQVLPGGMSSEIEGWRC